MYTCSYTQTYAHCFLILLFKPLCHVTVSQVEGEDSEYSYELFSVIIHKGGCYGGHYHVYIKDIDHLGHWEPLVRKEMVGGDREARERDLSLIETEE